MYFTDTDHSLNTFGGLGNIKGTRHNDDFSFFFVVHQFQSDVKAAHRICCDWPWYNRNGWLGVEHQVTYICCELPPSLTPSLPWCHLKTTNKEAKFEMLSLFAIFFALACERIFIETHSTENRFVIRLETILFLRRVNASFSPEILQAGAVNGLKHTCWSIKQSDKWKYSRAALLIVADLGEDLKVKVWVLSLRFKINLNGQ